MTRIKIICSLALCTATMILKYFTFSISIAFISWIVGIIVNALLSKTNFYKTTLSKLNFIKNENFSATIGLGLFKWIIQNTFFKYFNPKLSIKKIIRPSELEGLRKEMVNAEIGHLSAFIFATIFVILKLIKGEELFALTILLVNILMNMYPVLLQQENKRRIDYFYNKIRSRSIILK